MVVNKNIKKILIPEEEIKNRTIEIAAQIDKDFEGKKPILVGLLKGSIPFMAELMKRITIDCEIDFMDVSSYSGTESQGDIKINKDLDRSIKDENIIIVEDIIDTGKTLKTVIAMMLAKGAKEVKVVSLLDKKERREVDIEGDYVGFNVPNEFVVGFGLDFNQLYRNLPYVGVLKEECYKE